jgi:hypothetical protein
MKRLILLAVVAVIASGCGPSKTAKLLDGAKEIKTFRKVDPPVSCIEIEAFSVVSGKGCGGLGRPGTYQDAYNKFRNQVILFGGNAGLIESDSPPHAAPGCYVNSYVINGIAYKCPEDVIYKK